MKIHSELDKAIAGAYSSLREAIRIIEAEKDTPSDDDETFETTKGFMSNLMESSEFAEGLIQDHPTRLALELIRSKA